MRARTAATRTAAATGGTGVKVARLANICDAWAERLGVEPERVEGELEARFGALVTALTSTDADDTDYTEGLDGSGRTASVRAAVLYTDLYTIDAFVRDARRRLVRDEIDGLRSERPDGRHGAEHAAEVLR